VLLENNLTEVQLRSKRDKSWERSLRRFKDVFLAVPDDPYGKEIEILNPWVIDFENVKNENGINYTKASAQLPLKIVNKVLGYEIDYYLQDFRTHRHASRYYGPAFFKSSNPDDSVTETKWTMGRELNYQNSIRHLALSLLLRNTLQQGFVLYNVVMESGKRLRTNRFYDELQNSITPISIFGIYNKPLGNGIYRIFLPGKVEIHHFNKPWKNDYYADLSYAISWMEAPHGFFDVDRNGTLIDPTQLILSGYIGRQRVARSLPLDFVPTGDFKGVGEQVQVLRSRHVTLNELREKAWLTTNKPYFHPGETLWLGGEMMYQNPGNADSLSRVLYVDLIDSEGQKVTEETFRIEEGRISGGMELDKGLAPGDYLLRAYTHWSLNFPAADIFQLPIPILAEGTFPSVEAKTAETLFGEMDIRHDFNFTDSVKYRVLDLELRFLDEYENPVDADFVLTALDGNIPVELDEESRLENQLTWMDLGLPESFDSDLPHQIEYGISVGGRFLPEKKNASPATEITLVKGDLEDYGTVSSDLQGKFWATGLNFKDTAQVAVAALDAKRRAMGSVELLPFGRPGFSGPFPKLDYEIKAFPVQDETFLDITGDILLEEFVKEETKDRETMADGNYGYGEPNQQVGQEELEKMTMEQIFGKLRFVGGTFSNYTFGEKTGSPLLIIDGQNMSFLSRFDFNEILSSYEPSMLKSIKVFYGNIDNAVFGMAGYNGVIMIETKSGFRSGPESDRRFNSEGFQIFSIRGFSSFPKFNPDSPDDQFLKKKPTIHWDPLAKTENGIYKVRLRVPYGISQLQLRVEGQTSDGDAYYRVIPLELK
jgi:hypothetical protein